MIPQAWEASTSKHESLINEHGAFRAQKKGEMRPKLITQKAYLHTSSIDGFSYMFSIWTHLQYTILQSMIVHGHAGLWVCWIGI